MLAVADSDSEAPNTANVETSASPTMRAAAVWAVRFGLRIEFSRPKLPDGPSRAASGRPMTRRHRAGDEGCKHAHAEEDGHGTDTHQLDRRCGQADPQEDDAAHQQQRAGHHATS